MVSASLGAPNSAAPSKNCAPVIALCWPHGTGQLGPCGTVHIVKHVIDAGATIKVLDFPSLDLATPEGRGFLAMFSAMAQRERVRIIERTKEGRRVAMTNGVKMGPPFKLTEHQRKLAAKRMAAGESTRQIARDFNVSHNTIARLRWAFGACGAKQVCEFPFPEA